MCDWLSLVVALVLLEHRAVLANARLCCFTLLKCAAILIYMLTQKFNSIGCC